ncbi:hypothetical protein EON77_19280 [bacterium]|nr:MAG: hypothetical protein EON77_19280 [bacterium]
MTPALSAELATVEIRFPCEQVVFVKGIVEAHEGLATFFAERGGDVVLAAPRERAAELRELAADLAREFGGMLGAASV